MPVNNSSDQREKILGEVLLLGILGRIVYRYPEDDQRGWYQSLIDSETFAEIPLEGDGFDGLSNGSELLNKWSLAGLSDEEFADMQVDYLRLFIGVGKVIAAPWESVYFGDNREIFSEQTLKVRNWYRRFNLEPEELYHEPDDHIGLELIFVANLAGRALQALDEGDEKKFDALMQGRSEFLSEHLLKWGFHWCDLVTQNAQTDFYRGIGLLTKGALSYLAAVYDGHEVIG